MTKDKSNKEKQIFEILARANEGDSKSQLMMGDYYSEKCQYEEAFKWYQKAAEQGNVHACESLGSEYLSKKDYVKAFIWLEKAANQQSGYACSMIGLLYLTEKIGNHDYEKALQWFLKADEYGESLSRVLIAWLYRDFLDCSDSEMEVEKWIRKALNSEDDLVFCVLGLFYMNEWKMESYKKALFYFKRIVDKDPKDIVCISMLSFIVGDVKEGFLQAKEASEIGDPFGLLLMAYAYNTGSGVTKDKELERLFIKKAVANGLEEALKFDDLGLVKLVVKTEMNLSDIGAIFLKNVADSYDIFPVEMNTLLQGYVTETQKQIDRFLKKNQITKETISGGELFFDKLPKWDPLRSSIVTFLSQCANKTSLVLIDDEKYKKARRVIAHSSLKGHEKHDLEDYNLCKKMILDVYPEVGEDALSSIDSRIQELIRTNTSLWFELDGEEKEEEIEDKSESFIDSELNHEETIVRLSEFVHGFDGFVSNTTNKDVASIFMARMLFYSPKRQNNQEKNKDGYVRTWRSVGSVLSDILRDVRIDEIKSILSETKHFSSDIQWYIDERLIRQKRIRFSEGNNTWNQDDLSSSEICSHLGIKLSRFSDTCKRLDAHLKEYLEKESK